MLSFCPSHVLMRPPLLALLVGSLKPLHDELWTFLERAEIKPSQEGVKLISEAVMVFPLFHKSSHNQAAWLLSRSTLKSARSCGSLARTYAI
jgi:hypothetical protein